MSTDKIDLNAPVTQAEIDERLKSLTEDQLQQARQQQVDNAILNLKSAEQVNTEKDIATMSDQALQEFMRKNGFLR
jgi:endonuclease III-like uncharacterized protein